MLDSSKYYRKTDRRTSNWGQRAWGPVVMGERVVREGFIEEEYLIQNPMDIRKERGLWAEGKAGAKALRHDCAL